ncbi:phosphomannomutase/phosphoglucomutase [Patescibacteria group bacterium]|nr:phosphomannomutase/phosphoglucomutase [Patescibacteria group bacterium]
MVDSKIFRAYDIRGTYPEQLNVENAKLIGKAFGTYLRHKLDLEAPKVVVGMDCRIHGPELHEAFVNGLLSTGCNVTNIGLSPSPFLYFVNTEGKFDGGCNISASHNPKEYNGFKLVTRNAHAVFGDEIQKVYQIIEKGEFLEGEGKKVSGDYYQFYLNKIKNLFGESRYLKVVVDTGNGVAGATYPKILRELGHEVIELYTELDGTFPNHEADPIVEANLEDLKKKVLEEKADIGFGFDGDGDRLGVITEKGEFINADKVLMLLSKDVLSRHKGGTIVFTVSNSQSLFDLVTTWGGKPIMCEVGHSYVENAMTKHNAVLGGEQSGHFFLPEDYYPYDDALVTACRILNIVGHNEREVSYVFDDFPKTYDEPEIRPYCSDDEKFQVLEKVKLYFLDKYPNTTLDGIRMDFGNGGWAGIRVSNTSPRISITMEAQTPDHLEEIKEIILGHLKTYSEIDWNK